MSSKINKIFNEISMPILIIVIFSVLSSVLNGLEIYTGIQFALYQIFAILLPGITMVFILKLAHISKLELISYGYAIGYCLNILFYYCTIPFSLHKILPAVIIVISAISLIYLIKIKVWMVKFESDHIGNVFCSVFIIVFLFINFFCYNIKNILPSISNGNTYNPDLLYWIENTIALTIKYPPMELRFFGNSYFYHFFSSMQLAVINLSTGIDVDVLSFNFSYIQPVFLLVFGSYCMFKQVIKDYKIIFVGMVILLFTTGSELLTYMTYIYHIYLMPFGFDIGLGLCLFTFCFIIKQINNDKFKVNILIPALLLFACCTGSKGPIAAILLCGIGIICIYWLFVKKDYFSSLFYGISSLLIFIILYLFVLRDNTKLGNTSLSIEWFSAIIQIPFLQQKYNSFINAHIPTVLAQLFTISNFIIYSNLTIFSLFFISLTIKIVNRKNIDVIDISCIIMTFAGVITTILFRHSGFSQAYFMFACYPFALLFGIKGISDQTQYLVNSKTIKTVITTFLFVLIINGMLNFYLIIEPYAVDGYHNFKDPDNINYDLQIQNTVTSSDYEAYKWVRNNTDKNSVLLSDLILIDGHSRSCCVGAFCERQVWIEGYVSYRVDVNELEERLDLLKRCMSNDRSALEILINKGIDFIIKTHRISADFNCPPEYGNIVFENDSITIYELYKGF